MLQSDGKGDTHMYGHNWFIRGGFLLRSEIDFELTTTSKLISPFVFIVQSTFAFMQMPFQLYITYKASRIYRTYNVWLSVFARAFELFGRVTPHGVRPSGGRQSS